MIRTFVAIVVLCAITGTPIFSQPTSGEKEKPKLSKVVLVGDSIRLSYAPLVAKQLEGTAVVVSPQANGGDSGNVLKNLDRWVIREKPTLVHFNCGIHDTKKFKSTGKFQVSPNEYEANLRKIVERTRRDQHAKMIATRIVDNR